MSDKSDAFKKTIEDAKRKAAAYMILRAPIPATLKIFSLCLMGNGCSVEVLTKSFQDMNTAAENIKKKRQQSGKDQTDKAEQEAMIRQMLGDDFHVDFEL